MSLTRITNAPCIRIDRIIIIGATRNKEGVSLPYEKDVLRKSVTAMEGDEITVTYKVTDDGKLLENQG